MAYIRILANKLYFWITVNYFHHTCQNQSQDRHVWLMAQLTSRTSPHRQSRTSNRPWFSPHQRTKQNKVFHESGCTLTIKKLKQSLEQAKNLLTQTKKSFDNSCSKYLAQIPTVSKIKLGFEHL